MLGGRGVGDVLSSGLQSVHVCAHTEDIEVAVRKAAAIVDSLDLEKIMTRERSRMRRNGQEEVEEVGKRMSGWITVPSLLEVGNGKERRVKVFTGQTLV